MFLAVHEPLGYAQKLCSHYAALSQLSDSEALLQDFVRTASELSECELAQVFLVDDVRLVLGAAVLGGAVQSSASQEGEIDYSTEQLLQFSLAENRAVDLDDLGSSLYQTGFLPARKKAWRSLLCVPLLNRDGFPKALLVCASSERRALQGFAVSLGSLGAFALRQRSLLRRLNPPHMIRSPADRLAPSMDYGLMCKSAVMRQTCHLISKVLHSPYIILLTGETGTGKEVVSRAVHECGPRRAKAFVVQNCAAFPEQLLESELFGYRKGAFTGADRDRRGLFEEADGGTLLLDEIGDMPLALQAKILRVLQEGEIRPLGSNEVRKVDVRIIAATHRDLPTLITEGKFREDLYYRLAQFPIELPPLRQRGEDIETLARHFAEKACICLKRDAVEWSPLALASLANYAFPGNVRELKSLVERAVLLCDSGVLGPEHFPVGLETSTPFTSPRLRDRLEHFERGILLECLRSSAGNRSLTARTLGLSRRTLLYRIAHFNIGAAESGRA